MSVSISSALVTHFETIEQIRTIDGFREDNPLTLASYHSLIGYYTFKERVHCCVEKANGQLCKHEHGNGWLVRKTDGSLTLMGRDCANDKFGADSTVFKDIHHAENALRREARISKIAIHLSNRTEREAKLEALSGKLDRLFARITTFLGEAGAKTSRRLLDMARSRNGDVFVTGVKIRESLERGEITRERSTVQHRLGRFNGLDVLSRDSYMPLYIGISNIHSAFTAAAKLGNKPSKGVIDDLAGKLDRYDHIVCEVEALLQLEIQFMKNSMLLLCFLVDDRTERPKCARLAMHQNGILGGKDQAKKWLADQESMIISELRMDKIEIS
jgi:hypothetical protein